MANWKRRLWKWIAGLFAALVILLATVVGLFRLLTPLLPSYRVQVEQWASATLKHPVQIHSMGADWSWSGPEVALEDVRILSHDGTREIVAAQEVRLGLDWRSLAHGNMPRPSRVVLVAPRLEVQRLADGTYTIRGLGTPVQTANTDWRATLSEILGQTAEVVLQDGEVTLFDTRRAQPAVFSHIALRIDNIPDDHRLRGDISLPPEFGRKLGFELRIQGDGIDPDLWDWHAELKGTGLQSVQLLAYLPKPGGYLAAGLVDMDAEADSKQGRLQSLSLDLDARNLVPAAPLGNGVSIPSLQGRIELTRNDAGWRVQARGLKLQAGRAVPWPKQDLDVEFAQGNDGEHWSGAAAFLRLQDLTGLLDWAPASYADSLTRLHAFAPDGELSGFVFKLHLFGKEVKDWSVKGDFQRLGVHAAEGYPGFSGMNGRVDLADSGGQLQLDATDADVDFRPLFRTQMHADVAKLLAKVQHDASGWRVATDAFQVANPDGAAHGKVAMRFPADGSAPVLDLDATLDRGDARNKSTYFPVGIMPKAVVDWLDTSIKSGQVSAGRVSIHGKTSDFPYRDGKGGTFDIQFHVQHTELDYFPGWPALKDVDADVRFLDQGLEAHAHGGSIENLMLLDGGVARFADLSTGVLQVHGSAKGDAGDGLDFLRTGPLSHLLGGYLDGFTAKGKVGVDVDFTLPVNHPDDFALKGKAALQDVSLGPTDIPTLTAEHLVGNVDFGNYGISTDGIHGSLLGGPVTAVIKTPSARHGGLSLVSARGTAEAPGIAAVLGYGSDRWLYGSSAWQVDGKLPLQPGTSTAGFDLVLQSALQGLAIQLPAPFGKQATDSRALRADLKLESSQDLSINGSYEAALGLHLDFTPHKGGVGFERGELRIGSSSVARPAKPGFTLDGTLAAFDWGEWKNILPPTATPQPQAQAVVERGTVPAFVADVDLNIGRLSGFGQNLDKVQLSLTRDDDGWQGQLDSTQVAGSITVPASVDADHPIQLDMDRVLLADTPAAPGAKPASTPAKPVINFDPRSVPALDLTAKQFQFGRMTLNNISLSLVPQASGIAMEDVKVLAPTFSVSGDGTWLVTPAGQQHTALNADVESKDVEKSLQALGFDPGLTGDKGSIIASLNWDDSPMGDVVNTLGGTIHIDLQDGQIKEVQPGAGRIFGLLSINALPRRILLNFSDVFGKGFGYDSIQGDFVLQTGDAGTDNLVIKGPAASIQLIGRTGLAKHDFDQAMIVTPNVGSSLPIAAAVVGGLGVGAIVFLITEILHKPISKAGETRYHLTGSWDNPVLTKVPSTAPAPATRKP